MNLKDKLISLKKDLLKSKDKASIKDESETKLEDHPIPDSNIYRLYFVNYYQIKNNINKVNVSKWWFKPFSLPYGMKREEAFKVLSYLVDYIENKRNLKKTEVRGIITLNDLLDIDRLGFTRIDYNNETDDDNIVNLFMVTGKTSLFKKNDLYKKYFKWYHKGVTIDEVIEIYKKCGIYFNKHTYIDKKIEHKLARKL